MNKEYSPDQASKGEVITMQKKYDRFVVRALRKNWPVELIQKYVGAYQQCYFTYAGNPEIREKAASGGSITALLAYLLSVREIDGALVCRGEVNKDGYLRPVFFIAHTIQELLSAQGSKYIAVNFASQALPLIRAFNGRLAVVALPCDISILQRVRLSDLNVSQKIFLTMGLFCGHNSEAVLTDRMIDKLRPGNSPLVSYNYRLGHWRGHLQAEFGPGQVIRKPFAYFSDFQNLYFFCQRKCHHCFDHTAYNADLSAGDIWSLRMKDEPIKHTALITRTEHADRIVSGALESGALIGTPEPIDEVCEGQARTLPFHYNVSARARVGCFFGEKIKDPLNERIELWEYVVAWMVILNERISRSQAGRKLIFSVPRFFLKAYLYFMKLLESLSKKESSILKPPMIGIIGGTIWGNRGAESMLVTTVGKLKESFPDAIIKIFSYSPKRDRQLIQLKGFDVLSCKPTSLVFRIFPFALLCWIFRKIGICLPNRLLTRPVKELRKCKLLLDIGGISFVDGRELYLPFNILTIWPALLLDVPVVKMAQAMGPFHHPLNRLVARIFLPHCSHIFARGNTTMGHLGDLRLRNFSRTADIAFLYKPEFSLSDENEERVAEVESRIGQLKIEKKRKIIAISPSSVIYQKSRQHYVSQLFELIRKLDSDNVHFLFLANSTREGSHKVRNNDIAILNLLKENAKSYLYQATFSRMEWVTWDVNTRSIRRLIFLSDVLITSRFHAMVSGLSLKVPTLVIGWSHKYVETLADFGMQRYVADFEDHNIDLANLACDLLNNSDDIRHQLGSALEKVQTSSGKQFQYLEQFLK